MWMRSLRVMKGFLSSLTEEFGFHPFLSKLFSSFGLFILVALRLQNLNVRGIVLVDECS